MTESEKIVFKSNPSQLLNLGIFIACIFIIPIPIAISRWIRVRNTWFTLTNQRITMSYGVFSKHTFEFELYKLRDLSVEEPFLYRLFGLGHIIIQSTDKVTPKLTIFGFKDPNKLKDEIRRCAELYKQNRKWGSIN